MESDAQGNTYALIKNDSNQYSTTVYGGYLLDTARATGYYIVKHNPQGQPLWAKRFTAFVPNDLAIWGNALGVAGAVVSQPDPNYSPASAIAVGRVSLEGDITMEHS